MAEGTVDTPLTSRRRIIERPRLTRLLDESPARIKMLIAPAGYGKTTLARQWLATPDQHVWFSSPRGSNDVAVLALALAEALAVVIPGCHVRIRDRLRVTSDAEKDVSVLAEILGEDLSEWGTGSWLVIDEYEALYGAPASEEFIAKLRDVSAISILIASRERPNWVRARDLLYGDVFELSRTALAMTREEAAELLGQPTALTGVLNLADGWPAVLGLAVMSDLGEEADFDGGVLPDSLYSFMAEELFQSLDYPARRAVAQLALVGVEDVDFLRRLVGPDADESIARLAERGWLTWGSGRATIEMHPLLRAFLRSKIEPSASDIASTLEALVEDHYWDDAFDLIRSRDRPGDIEPLVRSARVELLRTGRIASLKTWLTYAMERGLNTGMGALGLVQADVAFREGRFAESEFLAASAAAISDTAHHNAECLLAAGRAAHAASREAEAVEHFRAAREVASTEIQSRVAALGELAAATDLELPEAHELLAECERLWNDQSPEREIAIATRKLSLQARFGIAPSLDQARWAYNLVEHVRDPLSTTSFRNLVGYYLAMAGFTKEAEPVVVAQRLEARRYRLEFVQGHADHIEALIRVVEGDSARMFAAIETLEEAASRTHDGFLLSNVIALRSRALVTAGRFAEAATCALEAPQRTTGAMQAEILASRSLALACGGNVGDAVECGARAVGLSRAIEVKVLAAAAHAVMSVWKSEPHALDVARTALGAAVDLRCLECFMTAYRGFPALADLLLRDPSSRVAMQTVLHAGGDLQALSSTSVVTPEGSWEDLSRREREVLDLIADGLSNRLIAKRLFISEATVKVHVHHILEKLQVATRTQAALRAPPRAASPVSRG